MTTDIDKLIAEIEKAEGPSRELDCTIAFEAGWQCRSDSDTKQRILYWRKGDWSWTRENHDHPPMFTNSIDVALTLVPENHFWTVEHCDFVYQAAVFAPHENEEFQPAKTAPLAICLAALKSIRALSPADAKVKE